MTDLIACLSTGKGTWIPVINLIKTGKFDKIFLVTNSFGKENFKGPESISLIVIDQQETTISIREKIKEELKGKLTGTEVALNLTSGSGKEHMALLSALLNLGFGIRLVTISGTEVEEI